MTFYLKYRPQKIEDLDLKEVREVLSEIVKSGSIPHAFLFAGPKGVGKTSAARILAKVVNCENPSKDGEPCNKCTHCVSISKGEHLDVIELDAASNRGVDDIRSLREAVKLVPASARKKVYIIDEAHMLTTEASNALLKTLEEPPPHVIFILATTNPEKLIETVRSRTTIVNFTKADREEIARSLKRVAKGENLKVEEEVYELISDAAKGALRDAHKILEQLVLGKVKLVKEDVAAFIGGSAYGNPGKLLEAVHKKDLSGALNEIENVAKEGFEMNLYIERIMVTVRKSLLGKVGMGEDGLRMFSKEETVKLLKIMQQVYQETKDAVIDQVPLEIAVIEWCGSGADTSGRTTSEPLKNDKKGSEHKEQKSDAVEMLKDSGESFERVLVNSNSLEALPDVIWTKILAQIRPKNTSTEALLRASKPISYDGETLVVGVFYSFHKEKLESNPHITLLEEAASLVIGNAVRITCTLTTPPERLVNETATQDEEGKEEVVLTETGDGDIIKIAKDIFGS